MRKEKHIYIVSDSLGDIINQQHPIDQKRESETEMSPMSIRKATSFSQMLKTVFK